MARWTDLARWRGPSPNIGEGDQTEVRGLVVHIAAGWFEGTIAWQRNPDSNISSHFVVSRSGEIAQMVDTDDAAWTQRSGNGEWLSVECEGFIASDSKNPGGWERLSDKQLDAVARLLRRCHEEYGVPLQTTTSPTGRGLGHHSMGADWGHRQCPGEPIIQQKPAIVARAIALTNGDDDMPTPNEFWNTDGAVQAPPYALKTDPKNTHWSAGNYLRSTRERVETLVAETRAVRAGQAAILAAVQGLDTESVIAAIDAAAAADATRDTALLEELRELASGGATADEVIDVLIERAARLSGAGE
jgi:hypothetical protein